MEKLLQTLFKFKFSEENKPFASAILRSDPKILKAANDLYGQILEQQGRVIAMELKRTVGIDDIISDWKRDVTNFISEENDRAMSGLLQEFVDVIQGSFNPRSDFLSKVALYVLYNTPRVLRLKEKPTIISHPSISDKVRISIIKRILKEKGIDINDKNRPVVFSGQKGLYPGGLTASTFERGRAFLGQGFYSTQDPIEALMYAGIGGSNREGRRHNAYLSVVQLNVPIERIPVIDLDVVRKSAKAEMDSLSGANNLSDLEHQEKIDRIADRIIVEQIKGAPAFRSIWGSLNDRHEEIIIRDPRIIVGGRAVALDLRSVATRNEIRREGQYNGIDNVDFVAVNFESFKGLYNQSIPVNSDDLGGIDLTPANMDLQTKIDSRLRGNDNDRSGNGHGIQFHIDPAMLKQLQDAPGFMPVIINIQPMTDLAAFLGLKIPPH